MKVRPVKTETDYRAALAEIERLFDARPGTTAGDRLEILTTLVEAYEEAHDPMPAPDPVEAIRYAMESRGLSGDDLVPYLGSRQRVKDVLNRKRPLTLYMIRRLHDGLGVSADILIRPIRVKDAA
jgi:HTH-type transcriptional regulator/antitoxin HigA